MSKPKNQSVIGEPDTQMTVSTAQAPIDHRARQIDAGALTSKKKLLAPFVWHPIETAPSDIDMLVAYDDRTVGLIDADENNGYTWQPYDGKRERGILKPTHWMRVEAPR